MCRLPEASNVWGRQTEAVHALLPCGLLQSVSATGNLRRCIWLVQSQFVRINAAVHTPIHTFLSTSPEFARGPTGPITRACVDPTLRTWACLFWLVCRSPAFAMAVWPNCWRVTPGMPLNAASQLCRRVFFQEPAHGDWYVTMFLPVFSSPHLQIFRRCVPASFPFRQDVPWESLCRRPPPAAYKLSWDSVQRRGLV